MGELNILFLKNNFQFSILGSGRIWTPPCLPNIPTTIKKFFCGFLSEISRFHNFDACFSDLYRSADLVRYIPVHVRARANRLHWSISDRWHIAQIPDIPLRRFGCPDLPPCSGDGIRAHFSGCLSCWSCPGVFAEFQSAQIKCHHKLIFAHLNAQNAHRDTQGIKGI